MEPSQSTVFKSECYSPIWRVVDVINACEYKDIENSLPLGVAEKLKSLRFLRLSFAKCRKNGCGEAVLDA
jgi:hypothetical protein